MFAFLQQADHWLWRVAESSWDMVLDTTPWLLLGLVIAAFFQAFVPTAAVSRWLGGGGVGASVRAALIGTPIPLCSCSVLPAAITLRRQGASPGATVSFLVSTPENGVDSIAVSYALLGPFFMIVRPIAAICSATGVGWLAEFVASRFGVPPASAAPDAAKTCCASTTTSCCDEAAAAAESCCDEAGQVEASASSSCCAGGAGGAAASGSRVERLGRGLRYAFGDLLDDIKIWLVVGIVIAGVVAAVVPPEMLADWGRGPLAMVVMLLVGVPMYICATASTPVAAALLLAGVSPGTVLVFLLAGPATNLGSLAIIRGLLGTPVTVAYLAGIAVSSVALGLLVDVVVDALAINIIAQAGAAHELLPQWVSLVSLAILVLMAIRPVRDRLFRAVAAMHDRRTAVVAGS